MEQNPSTSTLKFIPINFNLKRIIFSFLKPCDQIKIYWSNKKLRNFLPDSPLKININSLKNRMFYCLDNYVGGILELSYGTILSWTEDKINFMKYDSNCNLQLKKTLELEKSIHNCCSFISPINQNGNVIFTDGGMDLRIWDKNFKLIEISEESYIFCICNLTPSCFAIGLNNGPIKIYSRSDNNEINFFKEYTYHSRAVTCLLYIPKYEVLLSASLDKTINVINLLEDECIQTVTDNNHCVSSLISVENGIIASGSYEGVIKVWSINQDKHIECIKTVKSHSEKKWIYLYLLGNDFILCRQDYSKEFKIFDLKTYECLKTCKEEDIIDRLLVTNNYNIIIGTLDKKINVWKISE